jgi:hypothetical protein
MVHELEGPRSSHVGTSMQSCGSLNSNCPPSPDVSSVKISTESSESLRSDNTKNGDGESSI